MLIRFSFTLAVTCLLTLSVHAGQLYKIVDKKGSVTYSQFPPATQDGGGEVTNVQVASESRSSLTRQDDREFCGNIELPRLDNVRGNQKYFLDNIRNRQESWESALKQKVAGMEQRHRYSASRSNPGYGGYGNDQQDMQSIRDYRCAIHWAKKATSDMDAVVQSYGSEKGRLQGIYSNLETKLASDCGEKPMLDPTDPRNERLRSEWYQCSKPYLDDMRDLRREISAY